MSGVICDNEALRSIMQIQANGHRLKKERLRKPVVMQEHDLGMLKVACYKQRKSQNLQKQILAFGPSGKS